MCDGSLPPIALGAGEFAMDYDWPPNDPAPITTIAWRLAHLIVGFAETNASHFNGPTADTATFNYAGTAKEALQQFDHEHDTWVSGVRRLGTAGLMQPQGPTQPPEFAYAPMAKLILYTSVEVIHHGAEICLLRDLYLRNGSDASQR